MTSETRVGIFSAGEGVVEPTGQVDEPELLQAIDDAQKPVEDPHVVCIDERPAAHEAQPVREKVAGGNVTSFLHGAAAARWPVFTDWAWQQGPEALAEEAAVFLVKAGEHLGGHTSNGVHTSGKTDCGAEDNAPITIVNIARHGNEPVWVENVRQDLGDSFDEAAWRQAVAGYGWLAEQLVWKNWRTAVINQLVLRYGGVVEVLDARNARPDADPENRRHNHWAEALKIGNRPGYSNDRDRAAIPFFQVDVDPLLRMAKKAASSQDEFTQLLHNLVAFQYGTAYTLTKNQRIVR